MDSLMSRLSQRRSNSKACSLWKFSRLCSSFEGTRF